MSGVEAVEGPFVTRRQELGAASARSLLLTVLGEFVLPERPPGVDVGAARTARRPRRRREGRPAGDHADGGLRLDRGEPGRPGDALVADPGGHRAAARGHRPDLLLRRRGAAVGRPLAGPDRRRPREQPGAAPAAAHPAGLGRARVGQRPDVGDARVDRGAAGPHGPGRSSACSPAAGRSSPPPGRSATSARWPARPGTSTTSSSATRTSSSWSAAAGRAPTGRRWSPRSGSCRSGGGSRCWTRACRASCCRRGGAATGRPRCSASGTRAGRRVPRTAWRSCTRELDGRRGARQAGTVCDSSQARPASVSTRMSRSACSSGGSCR